MPTQQQKCVLNGVTFPYNPLTQMNNVLPSIVHTTTMGSGADTIWLDTAHGNVPYFRQDQVVTSKWPLMDTTFFGQLSTIVNGAVNVSFVDWFGVSYTVLPLSVIFGSVLKGGAPVYQDVTLLLRVISQP
jgi:hypothetical protein